MTDVIAGKILPPEVDPRVDLRDPPIFLLQASPTFAPWIQDGMYQRVPVGATGQVLTVNADGSVGWANSASGFANPMVAVGDLIDGGAGGTPLRLAVGSNGQVLTVSGGVPAWAAAPGFANPMTTNQDLIVGGAAGAPGRLGVGANGQVLTTTAGNVGWANSAAGFANPMTTLGDIITAAGGGTAQRLAVGANGQVLLVSGGVPAWGNSAAGFANPMTTPGDMIVGGLAGAATRLPAGANGLVLTLVSGTPAWAAGSSGASAVVFPSGDTTGVTDQANIMAANNGLPTGGEILLANGSFYVKPTSGANCLPLSVNPRGSGITSGSPVSLRGLGPATIIFPVGAGVVGVYYHRTANYGGQYGNPGQQATGYLRDFVVDGTNATGTSFGVDVGDGWGYDVNITAQNFTGVSAAGLVVANRLFWTEKGRFRLQSMNNTIACFNDSTGTGDHSHEYNDFDINFFANASVAGVPPNQQTGFFAQAGLNFGGSRLWLHGNMENVATFPPPGNAAALSLVGTDGTGEATRWYQGQIFMKVEANMGRVNSGLNAYSFYSDGNGYVKQCTGQISSSLSPANPNGTLTTIQACQFTFRGLIGDAVLAQLDTGPAGVHPPGLSQAGTCYTQQAATTSNGSPTVTLTSGQVGYAVGSAVLWTASTGGFTAGTIYYVVAQSSNTVQLSATPGGAAINATSTASGTLNPSGPPVPASGTTQQNYGPDVGVYITGGTGVTIALQGNPVPYTPSIQNFYFVPAGGSVQATYTTAPTWIWAPCSQTQN